MGPRTGAVFDIVSPSVIVRHRTDRPMGIVAPKSILAPARTTTSSYRRVDNPGTPAARDRREGRLPESTRCLSQTCIAGSASRSVSNSRVGQKSHRRRPGSRGGPVPPRSIPAARQRGSRKTSSWPEDRPRREIGSATATHRCDNINRPRFHGSSKTDRVADLQLCEAALAARGSAVGIQ